MGDLAPQTGKQWMSKVQRRIAILERRGKGVSAGELSALAGDVSQLEGQVSALEGRKYVQGVIPSSVVVTSGSASVAADGTVTFTGASSVSLRDVFANDPTGLSVYEITMRGASTSNAPVVTRMRSATAEQTAGYNYVGTVANSLSGPSRSTVFGHVYAGHWTSSALSALFTGSMTIFNPRGGLHARLLSQFAGGGDRYKWDEYFEVPGTYPSITFLPTAGTITGLVKVVRIA